MGKVLTMRKSVKGLAYVDESIKSQLKAGVRSKAGSLGLFINGDLGRKIYYDGGIIGNRERPVDLMGLFGDT